MQPGESVSYQEVRNLIGFDPQSAKGRPITTAARKAVRREKQMVIACVAKTGFKRVADAEITDIGEAMIRGIHRHAKRAASITACADPEKMSRDQRIQQLKVQSQLSGVAGLTSTKASKQIEAAVTSTNKILDYNAATIAAFRD